jgi:rhodanese-related sulfurtransferase
MVMIQMRTSVLVVLMFVVLTLPLGNTSAGEVRVISLEELKVTLDAGGKILLFNPQTEILFNEGYIPGSVNIPLKEILQTDKLPQDKETMIVSYCLGHRGETAREAAELVTRRGYHQARWLKGGTAEWVGAGYPLEYRNALPKVPVSGMNAVQLLDRLQEVVVLDIRPSSLQDLGWIKGSYRMPMEDLPEKYSALPRGRKIVVVDHTGNQVILAARFLEQKGFDVQGLLGGMKAWLNEGHPVEK